MNFELLLGAHFSIGKGIEKVFEQANKYNCNVIQLFTKNARSWKEKSISEKDAEKFQAAWQTSNVRHVVAHCGYLINLATPDDDQFENSLHALENEMRRADALNIPFLILHPGSHKGAGASFGLKRIQYGINTLFERLQDNRVILLLENTAGTKNSIGSDFSELAEIIEKSAFPQRLGICFDTCHGFAAGYDLRDESSFNRVITEIDQKIGLSRLKAVHLNDAKGPLNSKKDRHAHIGHGEIGLSGFRLVMRSPELASVPKIIETPKFEGKKDMDHINLNVLRDLSMAL